MKVLESLDAMKDAPIPIDVAIASVALKMAIDYCGATVVSDGTLYQQYKLEGRNLRKLDLEYVFECADQIERRLMRSPERLMAAIAEVEAKADGTTAEDTPAADELGEEF